MKLIFEKTFPLLLALLILAPGWGAAWSQESAVGDTVSAPAETKSPAEPKVKFTLTWPDLRYDGGEWKWESGRNPCPGPHCRQRHQPMIGAWSGGRIGILTMPFSDRLVKMSEDRETDSFDDYLMMTGPRGYLSIGGGLRVGGFFESGFMSVEGHDRHAEVNVTRLGLALESYSSLPALREMKGLSDLPFLKDFEVEGKTLLGIGLEMGLGNLNLAMRGDDLPVQWRQNEPFLFFTPMVLASLPITSFSRLELYAGYNFVSMNNYSIEFFLDEEQISGTDFNGFIAGVDLMFGFDDLSALGKKVKRQN